ncbi:hypothetical protein [Microvirga aerophila]|uniref:Calcium-binding protein n=1 Tax=Microvirga aerophila TaxID=670291 RepID=A0A512BQW4_9HYPH|nr:hypothetical protein [Microvirga aerophila]GEO14340.1 hypothetical protein MAE02_20360 [Microvirga aerophila]
MATRSGTSGEDTISGGPGADQLYGRAGNDRLSGFEGRDFLWGGSGNDNLSGGLEHRTICRTRSVPTPA